MPPAHFRKGRGKTEEGAEADIYLEITALSYLSQLELNKNTSEVALEAFVPLNRQRPIDRPKLFVRIIYVSLADKNARSPVGEALEEDRQI